MDTQTIRFQWVPDPASTDEEIDRVAEALVESGADAEIEESQGLVDIQTVIIAAMGLVTLGQFIWTFSMDLKYGGLVIDATSKPLTIKEDRRLPRGKVIVINRRGETSTLLDASPRDDVDSVARVLKMLTSQD